jgi:hypothetical protein
MQKIDNSVSFVCTFVYFFFRKIISENEKIREFLQILKFSETLPLSAIQDPNYRESAGKNIELTRWGVGAGQVLPPGTVTDPCTVQRF